MVAEELAVSLATEFSKPNFSVLDPFCGSGRLLLACAQHNSGRYVGIDVNPLAYIIAKAKSGAPRDNFFPNILGSARSWMVADDVSPISLKGKRKVDWFSESVMVELSQIVAFINSQECTSDEKYLLAACLSGATRDASYCRMAGWKLHRMNAEGRGRHRTSAWKRFLFRLNYALSQRDNKLHHDAEISLNIGDCRKASSVIDSIDIERKFDLIITSPPYGDSKSTVEYGAASGLCLDVVSNITDMDGFFKPGCEIDAACLGTTKLIPDKFDVNKYWNGDSLSSVGKKVRAFLYDYRSACRETVGLLKAGGRFVAVVGCRKAAGLPLRMDLFTEDTLESLGLQVDAKSERQLSWKKFPRRVNRYGGADSPELRASGVTETMESEQILVFRLP